MPLTVVNKIILGFASFGCLLLITSILSYWGLSGIQTSAEDVIEEKMPVQTLMNEVNTQILTLATITANGYHVNSLPELQNSKSTFADRSETFVRSLDELAKLLGNDKQATQAIEASQEYVEQSLGMYEALEQQLIFEERIAEQSEKVLMIADEASALMLDLSYLDSNDPGIETVIGTGNNIDNKLLTMNTAIEDLVNSREADATAVIEEDLAYQISNLEVDKDYLNRLAETVDTQGTVDMFNEQYEAFIVELTGDNGLVWMQKQKLAFTSESAARQNAARAALNAAQSSIESLYGQINTSTLNAQQKILDTVMGALVKTGAVFVIGLIAAVVLAVITTRSIARPLVKINRGLTQLSQGDLTRKLDDNGSDEFAALASKINALTESLRSLVGNILSQEHRLEEVTKSSIALGEESLQQVGEQRKQVQTTATNTDHVRETSHHNLSQITTAMEKLSQVEQQSQSIAALAESNRQQVLEQARQAEASAQVVHRLDENSRNIGSILDVIKTIAEQTNLLALNAAIEAARAGEQGRGFAVVADEVRTLANRTHNSTEEIEAMIGSLQNDAHQAVQTINTGREQAQQGAKTTEQVTEQVASISVIIQELSRINREIVTDTERQDALLADVAGSLQRIVELAELSAHSTERANESTSKIDVEIADLKRAVSKFRL
ncbi:MAG TPA: methyl-accepting chemotaxis protein [Alteromonas sp.]|jgi:methyl-accepting chemotaxis protein|nr:methyl-accepting chemotaxis protein [Alteromonas sp.]HCB08240.1 methyl-accepting chemotaxis protein [Alteromonas sp.]HCL10907.1 methyl-accepting chemotaxis protein [Alteromonas sp.]|tara:strand:+ start:22056 stop:24062 length:2007 start_codon:yes stop_codon:yes gene_type:complete